jgi:N-acetylglutamate synthase-like GNAT family acetyltransferase
MSTMKIINLADAPEHIPQIASWHHAQWGYLNPGSSLEQRIFKMQRYLTSAAIPTMFIAVEGQELLGTAALVESDMDSHPELSPWLASVYVNADYRQQGIGAQLVKSLATAAKIQGIKTLYLFTPDQRHFYEQLGWQFMAQESYRGGNATLMKLDLSA